MATIGWFRPGVEESQAAAPNIRHVLEPSDLEVDAPPRPSPTAAADDVAFIQYTSGSTGQPRGVVLSHANVVRTVEFMAEAAQLDPRRRGRVVAAALPRHGADRLRVHPALDAGRRSTCCRPTSRTRACGWSWSPGSAPPSRSRPTSAIATACATSTTRPARSLLAQAGALRRRAGAPQHHRGLRAEVRRAEPHHALLRPGRGHPGGGDLAAAAPRSAWTPRAASSRWAGPAAACACASWTARRRSSRGSKAEICVQSPGVMQGYYNNPEATRKVLSPDGWLRTGDLGFLDAEGYPLRHRPAQGPDHPGRRERDPGRHRGDRGPRARRALLGGGRRRERAHRHPAPARGGRGARAGGRPRTRTRAWSARSSSACREGRGHRPGRVLLVLPSTIPKTSSGKIQRSRLGEMIARDELRDRIVYSSGAHGDWPMPAAR